MYISKDGDGVEIHGQSGDSQQLVDIATSIMPEWLALFARKNADYGSHDESAGVLGIPGQYADIWRKMSKLKRAMWDGEQLEFEKTEEVISDLIGHLFLTLHMMRVRESAERIAVYNNDEEAVRSFIQMFRDEQNAYDMSFSLKPPFGELVRKHIAQQQEAMAERLKQGAGERIQQMIDEHVSAPRDGYQDERVSWGLSDGRLVGLKNVEVQFEGRIDEGALSDLMGEEFAEADAAQHGVGVSADGQREASSDPRPPGTYLPGTAIPARLADELRKWALGE